MDDCNGGYCYLLMNHVTYQAINGLERDVYHYLRVVQRYIDERWLVQVYNFSEPNTLGHFEELPMSFGTIEDACNAAMGLI